MLSKRKLKIILASCSFIVLGTQTIWLHIVALALLFTLGFSYLKELKNLKFWLIFALVSFLPCLVLHSPEIYKLSLLIFFRSLIFYLGLIIIAQNINLHKLQHNLPKLIGKRIAASMTLAFNLLPVIRHIVIKSAALFYFKSKNNLPKHKQFCGFALAILRQIIHAADNCAENMLLAHRLSKPHLVIITGEKHSGKTTRAQQLVSEFKAKNWPVSGILAPSEMENNRRSTILVKNIKTNETRFLASRTKKCPKYTYEYGGFRFTEPALNFAKTALLDYAPHGIVFLDEFGPIEFGGIGYAQEFKKLLASNISALFIVVRKDLLKRFLHEFNPTSYEIIEIEAAEGTSEEGEKANEVQQQNV